MCMFLFYFYFFLFVFFLFDFHPDVNLRRSYISSIIFFLRYYLFHNKTHTEVVFTWLGTWKWVEMIFYLFWGRRKVVFCEINGIEKLENLFNFFFIIGKVVYRKSQIDDSGSKTLFNQLFCTSYVGT